MWCSGSVLGIFVGLAFLIPFFMGGSFLFFPIFLIVGGLQAFICGLYGVKEKFKARGQYLICYGLMTLIMGFISIAMVFTLDVPLWNKRDYLSANSQEKNEFLNFKVKWGNKF